MTDTPQQARALRTNSAAQWVRRRFPAGTSVRATVSGQTGVVKRHVPQTNAQGGYLVVLWDSNGVTGRHSASQLERCD